MKKLVFATSNENKVREVNQLLDGDFQIESLKSIGFEGELPETQGTIQGNAIQKAKALHEVLGVDCFAEDTGLEVDALGGAPGVHSARYAGEPRSDARNIELLLKNLQGIANRSARFRTVIALILDGDLHLFEGVAEGTIVEQPRGGQGFGYDPVFLPLGSDKTFAEMDSAEKNTISHRGKAVRKLVEFLKSTKRPKA